MSTRESFPRLLALSIFCLSLLCIPPTSLGAEPVELRNDVALNMSGATVDVSTTSPATRVVYLPYVPKNWSPPGSEPTPTGTLTRTPTQTPTQTPTHTPTPTPTSPAVDSADLPCLYALNWWRDYNPPYPIVRSDYFPPCLRATSVDVELIFNSVGRLTDYRAAVQRQDRLDFELDAAYIFNSSGGVEGANVTKTYAGGYAYELEITRFCPKVGQLTGYRVKVYAPPYSGQEVTVGRCP